jgi:hypothetical protein
MEMDDEIHVSAAFDLTESAARKSCVRDTVFLTLLLYGFGVKISCTSAARRNKGTELKITSNLAEIPK